MQYGPWGSCTGKITSHAWECKDDDAHGSRDLMISIAVSNVPRYGDYYVLPDQRYLQSHATQCYCRQQWLASSAWSTVARFRDLILISMAPCAGKDDDALVMLALIATAAFTATAVFTATMYGVGISVLPA